MHLTNNLITINSPCSDDTLQQPKKANYTIFGQSTAQIFCFVDLEWFYSLFQLSKKEYNQHLVTFMSSQYTNM